MTLPHEEARAISAGRALLVTIGCLVTGRSKIARRLREEIRATLKHYPAAYRVEEVWRRGSRSAEMFRDIASKHDVVRKGQRRRRK